MKHCSDCLNYYATKNSNGELTLFCSCGKDISRDDIYKETKCNCFRDTICRGSSVMTRNNMKNK